MSFFLPARVPPPKTQVFWVVDQSGSMQNCIQPIRESIAGFMKGMDQEILDTHNAKHFIGFDSAAAYNESMDRVPFHGGSTEIEKGFRLLLDVVQSKPPPSKLIVIFVSDGADNEACSINKRLGKLQWKPAYEKMQKVLFTVAVKDGFPTGMVAKSLRGLLHNASPFLALVIPTTESKADITTAFAVLKENVFFSDHNKDSIDIPTEVKTVKDVQFAADCFMNRMTTLCAKELDPDTNIKIIEKTKSLLHELIEFSKTIDPTVDLAPPLIPTAANMLAYRNRPLTIRTGLYEMVGIVKGLLCEATSGRLLGSCGDEELQKVMAYGNTAGKYLYKAHQRRGAEISDTVRGLRQFLRGWQPNPLDSSIVDSVTNQGELFQSMKSNLESILGGDDVSTIAGLLHYCPLVGWVVKITRCAGTLQNDWLISISLEEETNGKDLEFLMTDTSATSSRFLISNTTLITRRDDKNTTIVPIVKSDLNPFDGEFGKNAATLLCSGNAFLRSPTALLSLVGHLGVHCLGREVFDWNVKEVLDDCYETYTHVYKKPQFTFTIAYFDLVRSDEWRKALATEYKIVDPSKSTFTLTCDHVNKFLFALYVSIREGKTYSTETLGEMLSATLAETLGRAHENKAFHQLFDAVYHHSNTELLQSVDMSKAMASPTPEAAVAVFVEELKSFLDSHPDDWFLSAAHMPSVNNYAGVSLIPVIFSRLNELSGNPTPLSPLSELETMAIFRYSCSTSSAQRNLEGLPRPPIGPDFHLEIMKSLRRVQQRKVMELAPSFLRGHYALHMLNIHSTPRPLPHEYMMRYHLETGNDVAKDLQVSEVTGLSLNSCGSLGCPLFGKPFKTCPKNMMSPGLKSHLSSFPQIAGYHKTVALAVKSRAEVGGLPRVVEELQSVCEDVLKGASLIPDTRHGAIVEKVKEAVQTHYKHNYPFWTKDGEQEWLAGDVFHLIQSYRDYKEVWSYEEFKTVMDRVYATHLLV